MLYIVLFLKVFELSIGIKKYANSSAGEAELHCLLALVTCMPSPAPQAVRKNERK